jgi:hypothetical protein
MIGAQVVLVADVPQLNVAPSCRAAAEGSLGLRDSYEACANSENTAREELRKQWDQFPSADRAGCLNMTTTGTGGTYTELLTCLEMKREARKLPYDGSDATRALGRARQ